ncbi:hypothetical protein ACS5PK_01865 [Roseateles sp. DB2]|uniref:hypothetical protein n=1 Tax=Roseateles sp. DB2 TaxID=3453717 RepID=UPI003EEE8B63
MKGAGPRLGSIARHRGESPDPLGFDALRALGVDWAQQASGELWTDYNLHDPGVSLLEALCYAITEDVFAARQSVPTLLGLRPQDDDAAWERFGLSRRDRQEPCRPLSERDWQLWLRQQLPQARQLQIRAQQDQAGRFQGLWTLRLQERGEADQEQSGLLQQALKAFWGRRNLAEDLAHPPQALQARWVSLRGLRIAITGERELPELLGEVLQRCDDGISSRIPDSPEQDLLPLGGEFSDGPLGRTAHAEELQWLESRHPVLHPADLARQLGGVPGLASVEDLRLDLSEQDQALADATLLPHGGLQRWGMDWALRLRWPEQPSDLQGWTVLKDGAPMRLELGPLLADLQEWRRVMYMRRAGSGGSAVTQAHLKPWQGFPAQEELPPLPIRREDHLPATAVLPALYEQALQAGASQEPGLRAQWTGYRALLEQGLLQVQVQREQMPRLYALDQTDSRSYWPGLPGEAQLPGVESLLQTPPSQLPPGAWIDDDPLERRHRLLDYQLALHGEVLDHSMLQGLPCYFSPAAWGQHLLKLKRSFAQRLPRLTQERHAAADYSRPLLDEADNTPPLQERLALQLGMMAGHSRLLGSTLAALEAQQSGSSTRLALSDEQLRSLQAVLESQSRARPLEGPPLEQRLHQLAPLLRRLGADTACLLAALAPQRFVQAGEHGPLLLLDDSGRAAWRLAAALSREQARGLAHALHELSCLVQLHGEGLHLVEPLLLRPCAEGRTPACPLPDDGVQLYLVCSGWTARARDERFRELTLALLRREAPAHLRCGLLWLDADALREFEERWQHWLGLRRRYCLALLSGQAAPSLCQSLDQAAEQLRQFLEGQS